MPQTNLKCKRQWATLLRSPTATPCQNGVMRRSQTARRQAKGYPDTAPPHQPTPDLLLPCKDTAVKRAPKTPPRPHLFRRKVYKRAAVFRRTRLLVQQRLLAQQVLLARVRLIVRQRIPCRHVMPRHRLPLQKRLLVTAWKPKPATRRRLHVVRRQDIQPRARLRLHQLQRRVLPRAGLPMQQAVML